MQFSTIIPLALALAKGAIAAPAALPSENGPEKRDTQSGRATYYYQEGAAGSCGQYNSDYSYIIALSPSWGVSSYCGRSIQITNTGGGQNNNGVGTTVVATVADTCPGCDQNHLDLSVGAFQALTGGNLDPPGTFNIDWNFL